MRAALCPLLVLAGLCKVASFGSFLGMEGVEVVAESNGNDDDGHYLKYDLQLPSLSFCTTLQTNGWAGSKDGPGPYLLQGTDGGAAPYCNEMKTKEECGHGDKVFRQSDNVANAYDSCRWVPKIKSPYGEPACRYSRYSVSCKPACLPDEGTGNLKPVDPIVSATPEDGPYSVTCGIGGRQITREFPANTVTTCKCTNRMTVQGKLEVLCEFNSVHRDRRQLQSRQLEGSCEDYGETTTLVGSLLVTEWNDCNPVVDLASTQTCQCTQKTKVEVYQPKELTGETPEEQLNNIETCTDSQSEPWPFYECQSGACVKTTSPVGFYFDDNTYPNLKSCRAACEV